MAVGCAAADHSDASAVQIFIYQGKGGYVNTLRQTTRMGMRRVYSEDGQDFGTVERLHETVLPVRGHASP